MSWSFSDSHLDFSQDCINFDGTNHCEGGGGLEPADIGLPDTHLGFKPAPSPFKEQLERFLTKHQALDEIRADELPEVLDELVEEDIQQRPVFLESLSESDAQIIDMKLDMLLELSIKDREALMLMDEEDLVIFLLLI